ncbi:hypothetical protein [Paenibacillus sp. 481]|uniref:hypothetical protein n=1 Tax=Paenibacillus sp. 481 TaxID=2835869 RepID=UPI001E50AFD4|nr:hypothetical protein [Paenibacillus sp. 481]UHA72443.1 hypothetical protein KIK04_17440 [Paenibacillus sp. 481]
MQTAFSLLHIFGAVVTGFYAIVPFILSKVNKVTPAGQEGVLLSVFTANRIAQYFLIVQFITGGYLMTKSNYTPLWMALTTILLLAIGALSGIMGKNLKRAMEAAKAGQPDAALLKKLSTFSFIIFVLFIVMIVLMVFSYKFIG